MKAPLGSAAVKRIVADVSFMDRTIHVHQKADGSYLLQVIYVEKDVNDPKGPAVVQRARRWFVSRDATETEIVETVFAACRRSMDHVTKEHFLYKGRRIYSPHFDVNARIELVDAARFDGGE